MPFTISHAAAVLPLVRALARRRLLSAAVIGSMVPDFGLFLPWRLARVETHSALALLTFCLPVGLATYWIFQRIVRAPLTQILPDGTFSRLLARGSPDLGSLRQWVVAVFAILAGAVTHLIWDGFTHEGARGVRMIPALDDPMMDIGGHHWIGFKLLQHASSLLGLVVVLWFLWRALRQGNGQPVSGSPAALRAVGVKERRVWLLAYAATTLMLSVAWFLSMRFMEPHGHPLSTTANDMAVAGLRGLAGALVLISLLLRYRLRAAR